jgi:hypothetical protein
MIKVPFWTQIDEANKTCVLRLFGQQNARTWLAEIRITDGYTVFLNMGKNNRPIVLDGHAELEEAMWEAEQRCLSDGVRDRAYPSHKALIESMEPPPTVIVRKSPKWVWDRYTGQMTLVDSGFRITIHRRPGGWSWFVSGTKSRAGTEKTRADAMRVVEDLLQLSAHQRLDARQALTDSVRAIHTRVREEVRKRRENRQRAIAY